LPDITEDSVRQQLRKIRVGICCMQKKMQSRPMREILNFLARNEEIEICRFTDEMMFDSPIDEWLRCDVLIAFYSTSFPLQKAIEYVRKYKPVMINDLEVQHVLWDRV
jgi:inositol hexakisphosphate/diphosphoinositol-pentakisphosphate kinase